MENIFSGRHSYPINHKRFAAWLVLLVSAGYFGTLALVLCPEDTFWSGDAGIQLLQVQGFLESNGASMALPYRGKDYDPDGQHFPLVEPYATLIGQQWYSTFPPYFAILTVPFYWAFGLKGLYVIPLISGLITVWWSQRMARDLGASAVAGAGIAALVALATPLAFYSATFWGHAPATAGVMVGLGWLIRIRSKGTLLTDVSAGICLAAACVIRHECTIFIALFPVALFSECYQRPETLHKLMRFAMGLAIPIGFLAIFNTLCFGNFLGLLEQHFQPGSGGVDRNRIAIIQQMLIRDSVNNNDGGLIPDFSVFLVAAMIGLLGLLRAFDTSSPDFWGLGQLTLITWGFVGIACMVAPNSGGAQLGPRYLLPAMPAVLIGSAVMGLRSKKWRRALFCSLLIISGLHSMVTGIRGSDRLRYTKQQIELPTLRFVQDQEMDVIWVGHRFFAQQAAVVWDTTTVYRETKTASDRQLLDRLYSAGMNRILYVSERPVTHLSEHPLRGLYHQWRPAELSGKVPSLTSLRHYHFEIWEANRELGK